MRNVLISIVIVLSLVTSIFVLSSCSKAPTMSEEPEKETSYNDSSYDKGGSYNKNTYNDDDDYQDDVHDWMKDQAVGKDYDYDDGGSYYCMGKGDTCNNKTRNAYDLYCSSCDPDGDNVPG